MQLVRITIAAEATDAMVAFYDAVFDAGLERRAGSPLFVGTLAGIPLTICPNELAGVVADQSRHQLRLQVADALATAALAARAGGTVVDRAESGGEDVVGIADPDGNTYELVSKQP